MSEMPKTYEKAVIDKAIDVLDSMETALEECGVDVPDGTDASEYDDKIKAVYEAGQKAEYDRFWDNFQQYGARKDYMYAFAGCCWKKETLKPKYPISDVSARGATGMFYYTNRGANETLDMTDILKNIDLSTADTGQYLFANAKVDNISVDLSNASSLQNAFNGGDGGSGTTTVTLKVSEKCTNYTSCFAYRIDITNLTFVEGSVIAANISFANCSRLTTESVDSIINALQDRTGQSALTVTFHTNVVNRLTDEQVLQINNKNWQLG